MTTETAVNNAITLKGSAQLVTEFFYYGINSILYQRGLYPAETFKREKKYGMSLLVTTDDKLCKFLDPLIKQMKEWLAKKELQRLVLVVSDVQSKDVLERWQFDVETDQSVTDSGDNATKTKSEKKIRQEISDVIRQITASVTFLPLLENCSFDILIYTGKDTDAPTGWADSGPCIIADSQEVQLRSFTTSIHKVDTKVSYKAEV